MSDPIVPKLEKPPITPTPAPTPGFGSATAKLEVKLDKSWIPSKFADCMTMGKDLAAKGDHARAREVFLAAAKLDRKQAEPMIELARSYIATNEKGLAIKHASKGVKLAPESSYAYNTLGRAEMLRHNDDAAILAFRQATELNADNVWAWNNLGLVYLTAKNYQEAVNALAEATSRKGTEGYMWNNLGLAYEQLDQLDDARDAFDKGAELGSAVAKASRKRLEGVDTIVVVAKKPDGKVEKNQTYETREPSPEDMTTVDDETKPDEVTPAEVKPDEAKPEAKPDVKDAPKAEGSAAPQTTL